MNTMRRVALTVVLLVLTATLGFAQIFPEEEMLDVVYTVDGSVLRGRIVEDLPDEYLTIEIYGGSAFVVAYANVERVREERNPDFGAGPTTLNLAEITGVAATPVVPSVQFGTGHIVGAYLAYSETFFYGQDWRDDFDELEYSVFGAEPEPTTAGGISWTILGRPLRRASRLVFGIRSGLGYRELVMEYNDLIDPLGRGFQGDYRFIARTLEIPLEALTGVVIGNGFIPYLGGGIVASMLVGTPESEINGEEIGHPSGDDVANPLIPIVRLAAGALIRLGDRWSGEARGHFDFSPFYGWYEGYHDWLMVTGFSVGVGYRFR